MRSLHWLLVSVVFLHVGVAAARPLEPNNPVHSIFPTDDQPVEYSLPDLGSGLVVVTAARTGGVKIRIDDGPWIGHAMEFNQEWAFAPSGSTTLSVRAELAMPGASYQLVYYPYEPTRPKVDPLVLSAQASALNEGERSERQQAKQLIELALEYWPGSSFRNEKIVTLARQADLLRRDGSHRRSIEYLKRAAELLEERSAMGPWLMFTIGSAQFHLEELDQARRSFCEVLALNSGDSSCSPVGLSAATVLDPYWAASAANYIGLLDHERGGLRRASEWYQVAQDVLPEWAEMKQAQIVNNLGGIHFERGNFRDALNLFEQAEEMAAQNGDNHGLVTAEGNKASVFQRLGERDQALEYFSKALDLQEQFEDSADERALTEHQIGKMYLELGDLHAADQYLSRGYAARKDADLKGKGESALVLGRVRREQGKLVEAQALHDEARRHFKKLNQRHDYFESLLELALDVLAATETESHPKSLDEAEAVLGTVRDGRLLGRYHSLRGIVRMNGGDFGGARASFDAALDLHEESFDRVGQIETYYQLAVLVERQGQPLEALKMLDIAADIIEKARLDVSSHSLRASFTGRMMDIPGKRADLLMEVGDAVAAVEVVLDSRMRVLFESSVYRAESETDETRWRTRELKRSLAAKMESQRRIKAAYDGDSDEIVVELKALSREIDEIERELDRSEAQLLSGLIESGDAASLSTVQRFLSPTATLAVYWIGDERSWIWQITHDDLTSYEMPGQSDLQTAASRALEELTTARRFPTSSVVELSSVVVQPLDLEQFEDLYILPDGVLSLVPFNALAAGDGAPLVERIRVTFFPGAAMLNREQERTSSDTAILVADPVFGFADARVEQTLRTVSGPDAGPELMRLQHSGPEASAVAATLAGEGFEIVELAAFGALKEAFLEMDVQEARVLHFATHGVVDGERPRTSGLYFSRISESGESVTGLLSLTEIYDLALNADLVVLSACDTALGRRISGEGPISLARGFLVGGARQVVASLWQVDDGATRILMEAFYMHWARTGSTAEALRQAQLTLAARPRWRGARYWGAFVLVGV